VMSRSKVVFPAKLILSVSIEDVAECMAKKTCQCGVRMESA